MVRNTLNNRRLFAEQGFLLLKNFFALDDICRVRSDIEKVFTVATQVDCIDAFKNDVSQIEKPMFNLFERDTESFINAGKQVQHSFSLMRLATSEKVETLLKELGLDYPNLSVRPTIFFNSKKLDKTGNYWKLEAHQDWRSSQGSLDSVTVWLPYVDVDTKLGALQVIPGSHLQGLLPCADVDYYSKLDESSYEESDFVDIEMSVGDLLIFNSCLVHRSGTNSTNSIRWSSQFRFNNLYDPHFIKRKLPNAYLYKPSAKLLDDNFPSASDMSHYCKKLKEE